MPVSPIEPIMPVPKDSTPPKETPKEAKCDCSDCFKRRTDEDSAMSAIDFENQIQDFVFVKKNEEKPKRKRRDSSSSDPQMEFPMAGNDSYKELQPELVSEKDLNDNTYTTFVDQVNSSTTSYVLRELKHYTQYNIQVIACREGPSSEGAPNCSTEAIISGRTKKLLDADNIRTEDVTIETLKTNNTNHNAVKVSWKNPPNPNGFISSVTIYYKRIDEKNHQEKAHCISQRNSHQNSSSSVILTDLETGNYSYRLVATSIAGPGNSTTAKYHMIHETQSYTIYWVVGLISVLVILVSICLCKLKMYLSPNITSMKLIASVNPDYAGVMYKQDDWEVDRDKIVLMQELGQGSFGMVSVELFQFHLKFR